MNKKDEPLDDVPGALYRALPRDEPPPAMDAAVLAAARRSVAKRPERNWAIPVSLAAVLVLSVGVTLRVAEERPDAQMKPLAPSPAAPAVVESAAPQSPSPAAAALPQAKVAQRPSAASASGPPMNEPARPANAPSAQEPNVSPAPERKEERTIGALSARESTEPAPFVPSPRADSSQPIAPAAASAADAAATRNVPADRPVARQALRAAPPVAAESGAPMMSRSAAAESSVAASLEARSPEAWLERIAEMRAQGRHKEADESYAEFRLRFPGHAITPEILRKIAPPR